MNLRARFLLFWLASALCVVLPRSVFAAGAACEVEIPCQSNSDCGAGTRCISGAATECTPGPDGGQSCFPAQLCEIPWQYTCLSDSDCGDGFTCNLSGLACNCSGSDAGAPGAVSTPCDAIPTPPVPPCDMDAGCLPKPRVCDGGTCLCWHIGTCVQNVTSACASASQCPPGWSCTSGMCEPPCYGDGSYNGPAANAAAGLDSGAGDAAFAGSSESAAADKGNDTSRGGGGGCATVPGGLADPAAWLLAAVGIMLVTGKRRRR